MIIAKRILSPVAVMLGLLMLSSCVEKSSEKFPFVPIEEENKEHTEYRIVISADASGEVIDASGELRRLISEQTGVTTVLAYDSDVAIYKEGVHEVLVGNTSRSASIRLLRHMRRDDYICAVENDSTVIGGKSDTATITAIERFCHEILPVSTAEGLVPEGGGFSYEGDYPIKSLRLSGVELSEYTLTVDSGSDPKILDVAYELQSYISENIGYVLDLSVGNGGNGRQIALRISSDISESGAAYIDTYEMGIVLSAKSALGLGFAAEELCGFICGEGSEGDISVELPSRISVRYGDTDIRIASMSLWKFLPFNSASGVSRITSTVGTLLPDLLLCGDIGEGDKERLTQNLKEHTSISQSGGASFVISGSENTVSCFYSGELSGLLMERYQIKQGKLFFEVVYISGTASAATDINIEPTYGDAPCMVITRTYGGERVDVSCDGSPYFSKLISIPDNLSGALSCYGDESALSVAVGNRNDDLGYCELIFSLK